MTPPTDDGTGECVRRDESTQSGPPRRGYWGIALVLLALVGTAAAGASPVVGVGATTDTGDGGVEPTAVVAQSSDPVARCTVSATSVAVGESVTLDASASENADDYQYDRYGNEAFGDYTGRETRTITYAEPGAYEPRVKVWSYSGVEGSDTAVCGTVVVVAESTPTPGSAPEDSPESTPTTTPAATPVVTATSAGAGARVQSTETPTPVPTAGATTEGELWFRYSPDEPSADDSVRLVAEPAVAQDAVETHGWDVDGDGSVDRTGRVVELPAETGGETTVTLVVERVDGTTASVTRGVPVGSEDVGETATPGQAVTDADGGIPVAALLGLLLIIVIAVAVRSRMDR